MDAYELGVIDTCIKVLKLEGVNSKKIVSEWLQELYNYSANETNIKLLKELHENIDTLVKVKCDVL